MVLPALLLDSFEKKVYRMNHEPDILAFKIILGNLAIYKPIAPQKRKSIQNLLRSNRVAMNRINVFNSSFRLYM